MNGTQYNLADWAKRYGQEDHKLLELCHTLPDGCWIAGGAVRDFIQGNPIRKDVDYFFRDEKAFQVLMGAIPNGDKNHQKHVTSWVDENGLKHQAIRLQWYLGPLGVIDTFDFTICQCVTDGLTLWVGPYTLYDIARKRLQVHRITYANASLRRAWKYMSYGFTACDGTITSMLDEIAAKPETRTTEVMYVD